MEKRGKKIKKMRFYVCRLESLLGVHHLDM